MDEDDRHEVLRLEYHDKMSGDDEEYLPCVNCKETFSPDYAETFSDRFHGKGYKCPRCGEING